MENFNTELVAGNTKAAMKGAGAISADLWQVEPHRINVVQGFNVRIRNEKYAARVRWIADSIKANGFYRNKPLTGFVARENGVDVIYMTEGHRRFEAVLLAMSEGVEIPNIPIVIKPKGTNMEDLTVDMYVSNQSENGDLTVYEQSLLCKRLATMGCTSATIRARLGYSSVQYVDDLLALAGAPLAVRTLVINEAVAATVAIRALRKHDDRAGDVLAAALVAAGGGRVTPKNLPGAAFTKTIKKHAEPFYNTLVNVQKDPGFQYLSLELQHALSELMGGIKK